MKRPKSIRFNVQNLRFSFIIYFFCSSFIERFPFNRKFEWNFLCVCTSFVYMRALKRYRCLYRETVKSVEKAILHDLKKHKLYIYCIQIPYEISLLNYYFSACKMDDKLIVAVLQSSMKNK